MTESHNTPPQVRAEGLEREIENLWSRQRWHKAGTALWRKFQKQIDEKNSKLDQLVRLSFGLVDANRIKAKRGRRQNKHVKKTAVKRVEPQLTETVKSKPVRGIGTPKAAKRMEAYLKSNGIGWTEFAKQVGTTERTLLDFRKKGTCSRPIFDAIAQRIGITREAFLKSE